MGCSGRTTYIPMQRGFVYLTAVLDWATRRVLAWRLSNTLTVDPCVKALEEAILKYGPPEIMNTDQGSQFTSSAFVNVLERNTIQISMDGKGCWRDNVFIKRLRKSVKYEEVYLHDYETVSAARCCGLKPGRNITYKNRNPVQLLGATPVLHTPVRACTEFSHLIASRVAVTFLPNLTIR